MYRTDLMIMVGTKNGYPIYRTVFIDKGRYVVKWNHKVIDVQKDVNERTYVYTKRELS